MNRLCSECGQPARFIVEQTGVGWECCQSKKPSCAHCGIIERTCRHCGRVGFHDYVAVKRSDGSPAGYVCDNGNACLRRKMRRDGVRMLDGRQ